MRMTLEAFRVSHLQPAQARLAELRADIKDAEQRLEQSVTALEYQDAAAASVQDEIEQLRKDEARWQRRYSHLTGIETVQVDGKVEV